MEKRQKISSWPLVGNEHAIEFLTKSIENGKAAGSYIFYGPDNLGKNSIAGYFAKVLLCEARKGHSACEKCQSCLKFAGEKESHDKKNGEDGRISAGHSDLAVIEKENDKKNISIDQVRDLVHRLSMSSFLNSYKIGIIKNADALSIEAANALLKTLEEPRKDVIIILLASTIEYLPETIVSRSQVLKFYPVPTDKIYDYLINDYGITRSAAKNFSRLSLGRPALALKFLKNKEFYDLYLERAEALAGFFNEDVNGRFNSIKEMVGEKTSGQESAGTAREIINIWKSIIRDLYMLNYGQNNLVSNEIINEKLSEIKGKSNVGNLLKIMRSLERSDDYLAANVSPKSVLESVAAEM